MVYSYPEQLVGIDLNLMPVRRESKWVSDPTDEEQEYLEQLTEWLKKAEAWSATLDSSGG